MCVELFATQCHTSQIPPLQHIRGADQSASHLVPPHNLLQAHCGFACLLPLLKHQWAASSDGDNAWLAVSMPWFSALCTDKYTRNGWLLCVCVVIYQGERKRVSKMVLNEVFELLKQIGAVHSESEFSRDWLGRSECYLRTLRFKRSTPSVGTLTICASKLQHYGRCMTETDANKQLGEQFLGLSERCHQQINAHASARWHIQ